MKEKLIQRCIVFCWSICFIAVSKPGLTDMQHAAVPWHALTKEGIVTLGTTKTNNVFKSGPAEIR